MQVDYLLIGQGLCGTFLSKYLLEAGKSVLVIDDANPLAPSRVAAGVINPVTGRRIVKTWLIDELIPFVKEAYAAIDNKLAIKSLHEKKVIDFFPNPFMKENFYKRVAENAEYLSLPTDETFFQQQFHYEFGYGEITPAFTAHLDLLLPAWRNYLKAKNALVEAHFDISFLQTTREGIAYKEIIADKIIFCDGAVSANHPYFSNLTFAPNKGEVLILEIPDLSPDYIYKKGLSLVPLSQPSIFWLGSNYLWSFDNEEPSEAYREQAIAMLNSSLKLPYKVLEHKASVRPATIERRPFVGLHPLYPSVGILNGMGTKGTSLAPYFAKQFADFLVNGTPISVEADIKRYEKILSKI